MARVLRWNGRDLPEELRQLPPGDYVVEPIEDVPPPTEEEEDGLRRALQSRDAGRVVDHEDVRRSVDAILKR
jgi:hypothetical protein